MSTAYVIDGMAVVQIMKNAGSVTFGELTNKYMYFQVITIHFGNNGSNRVDVVFDPNDKEHSMKEAEHVRRGSSSNFEVPILARLLQFPRSSKTSSPTL